MTVVNELVARISIDWSLNDTIPSVKKKKFILNIGAPNLLVVMVALYFTSQTLVNISSASGAGASAHGLFGTCRDQLESVKPNCESQNLPQLQTICSYSRLPCIL